MNRINPAIVGDDYCGKTMLAKAMKQSDFKIYEHAPYEPTIFDNFQLIFPFYGVDIYVGLWDTAGRVINTN